MGKLTFVYDIQAAVALGSLASLDAVTTSSKIDSARERGFRITKTEYFVDMYSADGEDGPLVYGLAVALNAAEVEEALEADPQSANDVPAQEQVQRPIFPLGIIPRTHADDTASTNKRVPIQLMTKSLNWSIPEGANLIWWFYNLGGALAAGALGVIFAKHYGVWLND